MAVSDCTSAFSSGFARCCSANGGERLCPSRWWLLFVPVAGATPSVLRAALMYLTAAGGFLLRRRSGGLNALLMALAVLLLVNPYAIASVDCSFHSRPRSVLSCSQGKLQHALEKPVCRCAETRAQGACESSRAQLQLHGLRYDIYSTDSADPRSARCSCYRPSAT